jgi:CheY-like chemotaxis protein
MTAITMETGNAGMVNYLLRLLPLSRKTVPGAPQPGAQHAPDPSVAPNGRKILVADDDAVILATTSFKLKSRGYAVVTARDPSAVIALVRDEQPDLILLDIHFPPDVGAGGAVAWDGFVLMTWLRQFEEVRNTPVIMITGQDRPGLEQRAIKAGAKAFFRKPIDPDCLLTAIRASLGHDPEKGQPDPSPESDI